MTTETAVSLAIWYLYKSVGGGQIGYRKDVMDVLLTLRKRGVAASGLGFKSTPAGIESDEVAGFIGRLFMGGYLIQESPIRLTPFGVELVASEIDENLRDPEVEKAMRLLGLNAQDLATETTARKVTR